ncbi:hypothetical protein HMPREF1870_01426 [Bacteroidales bacterium KA00344]|nr:hypothetical protein HMPREF1870_01426 [Bacteroidales bacterium KA00344]
MFVLHLAQKGQCFFLQSQVAKRKNGEVCETNIALCYEKALMTMRLSLNGKMFKVYSCDGYALIVMPFDIQSQMIKEVINRLHFKMP